MKRLSPAKQALIFAVVIAIVVLCVLVGQTIRTTSDDNRFVTTVPGWDGVAPDVALLGKACGVDSSQRFNIIPLEHNGSGAQFNDLYRLPDGTTATRYSDGSYYCAGTNTSGMVGTP